MNRLVLIDGHAILHRAYHAYPPLTTSKGELINAVYGFTSILLTTLRQLHPKFVAVAFDLPKPTFRHKKYKAYKAHRPKVDQELIDQIPKTKGIVRVLNIPIFEKEGWEADDVIGTLSRIAGKWEVGSGKWDNEMGNLDDLKQGNASRKSKNQNISLQKSKTSHFSHLTSNLEVIIVTGDKDALQLINDQVKVFFPARGRQPAVIFDKERFWKKYEFEPKKLVDYKALAGDQSDGIPGVKGIGPKTAIKLIKQFGDLQGIYQALGVKLRLSDEKTATLRMQNKLRALKNNINLTILQKLKAGVESAELSHHLAQIDTNVPIKLKLPKCRLCDYDKNKAIQLFEELEFKSLIKRLPRDWKELEEDGRTATLKTLKKTENTENNDRQMGLF